MKKANKLWNVDKQLFEHMASNSKSPEEYNFFQNMRFKEENEATLSNDVIMSEEDNTYGIYIVRLNFDEYIVGCIKDPEEEIHTMNLSEALKVPLHAIGVNESTFNIGEWLHAINYSEIKYNNNFDNE